MHCEYTLSIWPVIADNIRTKQQLCPCVVVSMVVRLGKRVQSLGETTHVQQQLCVCILLTWVSTDLIGVGVQSLGETTHVQQQLCVCILLTWVSTDLIGVGVQSFGGNYPCAATTVCMYFAHLGLHGPYWGRGTKFRGTAFRGDCLWSRWMHI